MQQKNNNVQAVQWCGKQSHYNASYDQIKQLEGCTDQKWNDFFSNNKRKNNINKTQLECTVRSRMEYLVDHYAVIQSHSSKFAYGFIETEHMYTSV